MVIFCILLCRLQINKARVFFYYRPIQFPIQSDRAKLTSKLYNTYDLSFKKGPKISLKYHLIDRYHTNPGRFPSMARYTIEYLPSRIYQLPYYYLQDTRPKSMSLFTRICSDRCSLRASRSYPRCLPHRLNANHRTVCQSSDTGKIICKLVCL